MDLFRLENIEYLWGLLFIPVAVLLFWFARMLRKRSLQRFGDTRLVGSLMPDSSGYKPVLKFIMIIFAVAALTVGIANPQMGTKLQEYKREGIDIMIALDVSNSMKAEDIKPNRLSRAKQAVTRLIENLRNDRIGMIVFAGSSFLQLPLTTDYSAAKLLLETIDTDMIPTQGTAIGSAIDLAIDSYSEEKEKSKVLIIITDGENHEDDALGMAGKAAEAGINIYTVGVGSIKGAPIPVYRGNVRTGYTKDKKGEVVVSKLDATVLQQIASTADGEFIRFSSSDPDLSAIMEEIGKMEKEEFSTMMFSDYEDKFQYLIAAALLFLIFEFIISERKNKFISALNRFAEKTGR